MQKIEDLQKVFRILEELRKESIDKPLIVEGKEDRKALNKFNIHNLLTLSGNSLTEIPKKISSKKAIILTDYDQEGKRLAAKLSSFLEKEGITPILRFKAALGKILRITEIESIDKFLKGGYLDGKDKPYYYKIYNSCSDRSRWSSRGI